MRRRLNLTVLAVTAMVTLAFLIPLGAVVRIVATDRALSVADQEARTLAGVLASESSHAALQSVVGQLNADGSGRQVAVFTTGEATLGAPVAVPITQLSSARAGHAFSASYRGYHARLGSRAPSFGHGCRGRERAGQPPDRGGLEGMACPRRGRRGHPGFGPPPLGSSWALSGSVHRGPRHGDPTSEHRRPGRTCRAGGTGGDRAHGPSRQRACREDHRVARARTRTGGRPLARTSHPAHGARARSRCAHRARGPTEDAGRSARPYRGGERRHRRGPPRPSPTDARDVGYHRDDQNPADLLVRSGRGAGSPMDVGAAGDRRQGLRPCVPVGGGD